MKWTLVAPVAAAPLGVLENLLGLTSSTLELDPQEAPPTLHYQPSTQAKGDAAPPFAQHPLASQQTIRDLEWGSLNFIHTTDTHSWLAGHLLQPDFGANWGDFVSFSAHMHARAAEKHADLILVDTGDRTDGNGLGDATKEKAVHIRSLFEEVPYDLITIGNHELYDGHVTLHEYNQLFAHFGEAYIVSNVDVKAKKVKRQQYADLKYLDSFSNHKWIPMGNKYRLWQTKNTNKTLLGLGFLFDFSLNDDHYSKVTPVKTEIKKDWFQSLLANEIAQNKIHAIVLAGHIPVRDSPDFEAIVAEIRKHNSNIPILLFGGHTHIRDAKVYDQHAWALESGRYLETIGFASLSSKNSTLPPNNTFSDLTYSRSYIDFNRRSLAHHAHAHSFDTLEGRKVSSKIAHYRNSLDLDRKLACIPKTYYTNQVPYPHPDSIFSLLGDKVLPRIEAPHRNRHPAYILLNTGAIRYDLIKGAYTRDSGYIVTPFSKKWLVIEDVPRDVADDILAILNGLDQVSSGIGHKHTVTTGPSPVNSTLTPGYLTHDDFGSLGDDTRHEGWTFHRIPNVIHSQRNVNHDTDEVDLVFEEFLTHFVVQALVELRKYRLIRPSFYTFSPLHEALAEYFGSADSC